MKPVSNNEPARVETEPLGPKAVVGKVVTHPVRDASVQSYLPEVAKGMLLTATHFCENTKEMMFGQRPEPTLESINDGINTICYPEQRKPYADRYRGQHRLMQRADGSPRCVACLCCSTACPAQCIVIEPGEYPEGDPRRGYERFPVRFVIDEMRCIFCGYCVEACPCDAIRMDTGMHAVPYDSREQFIVEKEALLGFPGRDGDHLTKNKRHEPGEPTYPGVTREHGH